MTLGKKYQTESEINSRTQDEREYSYVSLQTGNTTYSKEDEETTYENPDTLYERNTAEFPKQMSEESPRQIFRDPKSQNNGAFVRSIRCLQVICAVLLVAIIVMAAFLGHVISDQKTQIDATEAKSADTTHLETSITQLDSKNQQQLGTIQEHSASIADLEADTTHLETSITQLDSKNQQQLGTIQEHSASIADLEDALDKKVQILMDQQRSLNARVKNNEDSLTKLAEKMEKRKVAFSAMLGSTTEQLPVGSTVVFDSVIYQDGNGYNPEDGVFTCPETGVYMFSVVIDNNNKADSTGKEITVELKVDSVWKALVVSEKFHSMQDDQNSNLVILKINQGQKVWVETYSKSDVRIWKSFSTFSGALLYI